MAADDESRKLSARLLLESGARLNKDSIVDDCPRFKRRKGAATQCPYPGQPFGEGAGSDDCCSSWRIRAAARSSPLSPPEKQLHPLRAQRAVE